MTSLVLNYWALHFFNTDNHNLSQIHKKEAQGKASRDLSRFGNMQD